MHPFARSLGLLLGAAALLPGHAGAAPPSGYPTGAGSDTGSDTGSGPAPPPSWAVRLDPKGWNATADSHAPSHGSANAIDGDVSTFWRSASDSTGDGSSSRHDHTAASHYIQIDMQRSFVVNGISYQPPSRKQGDGSSIVGEHQVLLSDDGKTWGEPAAFGTWDDADTHAKYAWFANTTARFVSLEAKVYGADKQRGVGAGELTVYSPDAALDPDDFNPPSMTFKGRWDLAIDLPGPPGAVALAQSGKQKQSSDGGDDTVEVVFSSNMGVSPELEGGNSGITWDMGGSAGWALQQITTDSDSASSLQKSERANSSSAAAALPDGGIFAFGGRPGLQAQGEGQQSASVELYDPEDKSWDAVAPFPAPPPPSAQATHRQSKALLLPDTRVLLYPGDDAAYAQVWSPPYLFTDDQGTRAVQPVVKSVVVAQPSSPQQKQQQQRRRRQQQEDDTGSCAARPGDRLTVATDTPDATFALVRLNGGGGSEDRVALDDAQPAGNNGESGNTYAVSLPSKADIAAGPWMLFAVSQSAVPSNATLVTILAS